MAAAPDPGPTTAKEAADFQTGPIVCSAADPSHNRARRRPVAPRDGSLRIAGRDAIAARSALAGAAGSVRARNVVAFKHGDPILPSTTLLQVLRFWACAQRERNRIATHLRDLNRSRPAVNDAQQSSALSTRHVYTSSVQQERRESRHTTARGAPAAVARDTATQGRREDIHSR